MCLHGTLCMHVDCALPTVCKDAMFVVYQVGSVCDVGAMSRVFNVGWYATCVTFVYVLYYAHVYIHK